MKCSNEDSTLATGAMIPISLGVYCNVGKDRTSSPLRLTPSNEHSQRHNRHTPGRQRREVPRRQSAYSCWPVDADADAREVVLAPC